MSTIVPCPKCSRLVMLPARGEGRWWVRCPICRREFLLQEAINATPPVLEFIHRGDGPMPAFEEASPVAPTHEAENLQLPTASHELPTNQQVPVNQQIPELLGSGIPEVPKQMVAKPPLGRELGAERQAAVRATAPQSATPQSSAQTTVINDDEPWMSAPTGAKRPVDRTSGYKRRKRKSSPQVEFLKIVLGGIAGLLIAYAVLFWGFKVDLANLANHLPNFMVPTELRQKDDSGAGMLWRSDKLNQRHLAGRLFGAKHFHLLQKSAIQTFLCRTLAFADEHL